MTRQADWIDADPDYAMRFRDGDGLYDDTRTISGGLGPVYAGYSCGSATAMPGARNRSYGTVEAASAKGEAALTVSLPCWCTSAARTAHFSRTTDAYFMTKPFTV